MTLEQIKNRQARINSDLEVHVAESNSVMNTITGSFPCPDNQEREAIKNPNGYLEEINAMQNYTEELLNILYANQKRLVEHTYAPNEPIKVS